MSDDGSDRDEFDRDVRSLAELPEVGPGDLQGARTLRRARARFLEEHRLGGSPVLRSARHLYSDLVAPALLMAGAAVYLLWAVEFCNALRQAG